MPALAPPSPLTTPMTWMGALVHSLPHGEANERRPTDIVKRLFRLKLAAEVA